jgi:hypothetical protein
MRSMPTHFTPQDLCTLSNPIPSAPSKFVRQSSRHGFMHGQSCNSQRTLPQLTAEPACFAYSTVLTERNVSWNPGVREKLKAMCWKNLGAQDRLPHPLPRSPSRSPNAYAQSARLRPLLLLGLRCRHIPCVISSHAPWPTKARSHIQEDTLLGRLQDGMGIDQLHSFLCTIAPRSRCFTAAPHACARFIQCVRHGAAVPCLCLFFRQDLAEFPHFFRPFDIACVQASLC